MSANDGLLLIGHGSTRYPDASIGMRRHVELLRAEKRFAQVEIGLLNGLPTVQAALTALDPGLIRLVPFFMEDGYFTRVAVPRAVGALTAGIGGTGCAWASAGLAGQSDRGGQAGPRQLLLCPPVGSHDGMADIIERQARSACRRLGVPSQAVVVVVVGHGSASAPGRALALHRHASHVGATGRFAGVEAACLEEAPFVADTLAMRRANPVVVIGFFANHGGHVRDDVPALIAAEQAARGDAGRAVLFAGCASDDPAMVRIILDRAFGDTEEE